MKLLNTQVAFSNKWIQIYKKRYKLNNGQEDDFFVIGKNSQVVAILALEGNYAYLVKQYRWAVNAETLDIPGGSVDLGEEPLQAAKRELLEETGYKATEWELLCQRYLDSGQKDCIQHIYVARGLHKVSPPNNTPTETVTVVKTRIDSIMSKLVESSHEPIESTIAIAAALYFARTKTAK